MARHPFPTYHPCRRVGSQFLHLMINMDGHGSTWEFNVGAKECRLCCCCFVLLLLCVCVCYSAVIKLHLLGTGRENHQELLANLSGGRTFSNLDLSHVYKQVPLTEDSPVHDCVHDHDHPQRPVQVHEITF